MEKSRANVITIQVKAKKRFEDSIKCIENERTAIQWCAQGKPKFSERLSRNMALAAALVICVAGARAMKEEPTAQAVFDTVQSQLDWELNDSLGKLSFVSNLVPEASMVFWNGTADIQVMAPLKGDILHVWTASEPYLSMVGESGNVYCGAEGEVMAVAHGDNEERIVRIRHNDCWETVYGNLTSCSVGVGDRVNPGDLLGQVDEQVYFELRQNGRPIDPTYLMKDYEAHP